jgi:hypothetical protein
MKGTAGTASQVAAAREGNGSLRGRPRPARVRALFVLNARHRRGTQAMIDLNLAREAGATRVVLCRCSAPTGR